MKQERVYESFLFEWNDEKRERYENALIGIKKYKRRSRVLLFLNLLLVAFVAYSCLNTEIALIEHLKIVLENFLSSF